MYTGSPTAIETSNVAGAWPAYVSTFATYWCETYLSATFSWIKFAAAL